ncbi:MAG: hypothetical protein E7386_02120 [Ruminococcaceae bacterium]|nr:hypothetical protein [Oscillospiraceae bacterium]
MTTATNEINLQDLENVTGGKITAEGEKKLVAGLKLAKATGVSKAKVLELLPQYYDALHGQFPETSLKEVKDYINKNWNKI